jgi:hypothetical protein
MKQRAIQVLGKVKPDSWEYRKTQPYNDQPIRDGLYKDCCNDPSPNSGQHKENCPRTARLTEVVYPFEIRPGDLIAYWGNGPGIDRHYFWVTTKYPHVWDCTAKVDGAHLFLQFLNDNGEYSPVLSGTEKIERIYIYPGKGGGISEHRKLHPKTRRFEIVVVDEATGLYDFEEEQLCI